MQTPLLPLALALLPALDEPAYNLGGLRTADVAEAGDANAYATVFCLLFSRKRHIVHKRCLGDSARTAEMAVYIYTFKACTMHVGWDDGGLPIARSDRAQLLPAARSTQPGRQTAMGSFRTCRLPSTHSSTHAAASPTPISSEPSVSLQKPVHFRIPTPPPRSLRFLLDILPPLPGVKGKCSPLTVLQWVVLDSMPLSNSGREGDP